MLLYVVIDTRGVNAETGDGAFDTSTVVNLWASTILAPDPQAYFDALPEETKQAMVAALSDNSIFTSLMAILD